MRIDVHGTCEYSNDDALRIFLAYGDMKIGAIIYIHVIPTWAK